MSTKVERLREQERLLARLRAAALLRDEAEREWRAHLRTVNELIAEGEALLIGPTALARASGVSRQALWKRRR